MMPFTGRFRFTGAWREARTIVVGAVGLLALAGPGAAHAGWRFAQWGMSAAEVRAASPTPLTDKPGREGWILLTTAEPLVVNDVRFKEVYFSLKGDKLQRIVLNNASWTEVDSLSQALRATLGPPVHSAGDKQYTRLVFSDTAKGNTVQLYCWQYQDCTVTYMPLEEGF